MSSPTQRTLKLLREEGWTAQVVERWNPFAHIRQDLFGGIDVLAMKPEPNDHYVCIRPPCDSHGILGIQACAGASHAARVKKLLLEKRLAVWLAAGGQLEVWSFSKKGARGKRKLWTVRKQAITLADFIPVKEAA